jgi:hypothetical protein
MAERNIAMTQESSKAIQSRISILLRELERELDAVRHREKELRRAIKNLKQVSHPSLEETREK